MVSIALNITNGLNFLQIFLYLILTSKTNAVFCNTFRNYKIFASFAGLTVLFPIHLLHLFNKLSFWFAYAHTLIHSTSLIFLTYILLKLKQNYQQIKLTMSKQCQHLIEHKKTLMKTLAYFK